MEQTLCHLEYFATEGKRSSVSWDFNLANLLQHVLHCLTFAVLSKMVMKID